MKNNCIVCNIEYEMKHPKQRYCSKKCRWKYWDKQKVLNHKSYNKYTNIKKRYGLTKEKYNELEKNQNGECKICSYKPVPPYRSLHVDHSHVENKVRGLLCSYCNRKIIGAIEKIGLEKIANYLGYKIVKEI